MANDNVLASAVVEIRADLSLLAQDLEKTKKLIEQHSEDWQRSVGGISFSSLAQGLAAAGLGYETLKHAVVGSLEAFADAELQDAKLNAVLAATKDATGLGIKGMVDFATAMESTTKFSDETVKASEAVLMAFKNISDPGIFKSTITAAGDLATVTGTDLQSAVFKLGKALENPAEGMTMLRREGVIFTAEQKEQIKVLQESGNLIGAQGYILDAVSAKYGGAADAAGKTFGGQLMILKNSINNAQEAIGKLMAEVITPLIPKFIDAADNVKLFYEALAGKGPLSKIEERQKMFGDLTLKIGMLNKMLAEAAPGSEEYNKGLAMRDGYMRMLHTTIAGYTEEVNKQREAEKKQSAAVVVLTQEQVTAKKQYADQAKAINADLGTDEEKLTKKYELELSKITVKGQEANDLRAALDRKYTADLGALREKATEDFIKHNDRREKDYQDSLNAEVEAAIKAEQERSKAEEKYKTVTTAQLVEILQAEQTTAQERIAARDELYRRDSDILSSMKQNFKEAAGANKTMYDQMGEAGRAWGTATKTTLASAINDGIMGTPKTPEEYGRLLGGAMAASFSTLASEILIAGLGNTYTAMTTVSGPAGTASGTAWGLGWIGAAVVVIGAGLYATKDIWEPFFRIIRDNWSALEKDIKDTFGNLFSSASIDAALKDLSAGFLDVWAQAANLLETLKGINEMNNPLAQIQMPDIPDPFTAMKQSINDTIAAVQDLIDAIGSIPGIPGSSASTGGGGGLGISGTLPGIGGFSFANGGIMTARGALPLNAYSGGGIADRPQVAIFGEGRMNEAYVPLPDGKSIPVTMRDIPRDTLRDTGRDYDRRGDVVLQIDGVAFGRIIGDMAKSGRLKIDPSAILNRAYA